MTVPHSFRDACSIEIIHDEDGEECALNISCDLCDRSTGQCITVNKSIDLRPIVDFLYQRFAAIHARMHAGETQTSGLGDFLSKAKDAAKRIASSKGIKDLYNKVKATAGPVLKAAVKDLPGGEATMALATKTYDQVMKARSGDKKALADLKKVASKALAGNPLASQIMSTAKTLSNAQDLKDGKDPSDMAHRTARIEAVLNPLLPPQNIRDHRTSGTELLVGRRGPKPMPHGAMGAAARAAQKKIRARSVMARDARGGVRKLTPVAQRIVAPPPAIAMPVQMQMPPAPEAIEEVEEEMVDEMYDEGYGEEEIADEISGWREWLYSRPYRSPAAAALQGDIGAGMKLRYLYSNGLGLILQRVG